MNKESDKKELLDSMDIIAQAYYDRTFRCYDGRVISQIDSNIYVIEMNRQSYNLSKYGSGTPAIGSLVKVFVPNNIMSQAWFLA